MDSVALACVLVSAFLHATWNILLKTAGDPLRTATVGMAAAFTVQMPLVAVAWLALGQPALPPQAVCGAGLIVARVPVPFPPDDPATCEDCRRLVAAW